MQTPYPSWNLYPIAVEEIGFDIMALPVFAFNDVPKCFGGSIKGLGAEMPVTRVRNGSVTGTTLKERIVRTGTAKM